jgi:hypothetical protein
MNEDLIKPSDILSNDEIIEGNKMMSDFMELEHTNHLYNESWDELMKVVEKISETRMCLSYNGINAQTFNFKHMMFHEIIGNRNYLYRRCVKWIKYYYSVI